MTPQRFIQTAAAVAGAAVFLVTAAAAQTTAGPRPPCAQQADGSAPAYGEPGTPPAVEIWHDTHLSPADGCPEALRGQMKFVVVLTGGFPRSLSIYDIAARIGAISKTEGLTYWSVSDAEWRPLISQAFALATPDLDPATSRRDFTAREVLSGQPLYFAQNDTRSTGLNIYSLTARSDGPNRLDVEIANLTPIRFTFVTLYDVRTLLSVHFFSRLKNGNWGYYGLSAVRRGSVEGHEKSYVNRAVAYFRFLAGQPGDATPPLAP